jgi:hypothetical protein
MHLNQYKHTPDAVRRASTLHSSAIVTHADRDAEGLAISRQRVAISARLGDLTELSSLSESAFDALILWLLDSGISNLDLRAFDLIPPPFCSLCLSRVRSSSTFSFIVHVLTFIQTLAHTDPAHFLPGLIEMGTITLVESLLAEDPHYLCIALNVFSVFLTPDDAASSALVNAHFKRACRLAQSDAPRDAEIDSALFFIESAFAARLVTAKHARRAAACLIFHLTLRFPHPAICRISYSLCAMVDQFPAHVMAFGQTRVLLTLERYLAEAALPPDSLSAVLCVFQRLFFHIDAHSVYLYSDPELFALLLTLLDFPEWRARRAALRTLAIALQGDRAVAPRLLGALPVLERAADPPFAFVRERANFAILVLESLPAADAADALPAVAGLIGGAEDLGEEQAARLALAVERAVAAAGLADAALAAPIARLAADHPDLALPALRGLTGIGCDSLV